jgi:hypothetical protein
MLVLEEEQGHRLSSRSNGRCRITLIPVAQAWLLL